MKNNTINYHIEVKRREDKQNETTKIHHTRLNNNCNDDNQSGRQKKTTKI